MSAGAWAMLFAFVLMVGSLGFLIFTLIRSIQSNRTPGRSIWRTSVSAWD